jgi:hypothetical protein
MVISAMAMIIKHFTMLSVPAPAIVFHGLNVADNAYDASTTAFHTIRFNITVGTVL